MLDTGQRYFFSEIEAEERGSVTMRSVKMKAVRVVRAAVFRFIKYFGILYLRISCVVSTQYAESRDYPNLY